MHLPAAATVPTSAPARIEALDALRGLALCGILFANLPAITGMNPTPAPGSSSSPPRSAAWR